MLAANLYTAMSGLPHGPYTVEEAKADTFNACRSTMLVGHELIGSLGRCVHVTRAIGVGGETKRDGTVLPIHAGAGCVRQVDMRIELDDIQYGLSTLQIRVYIRQRVLQ